VKLSNALKATQSEQPWFIVFFVDNKRSSEPSVYAIHFCDDLISRTLRAVREAEARGYPLNRRHLTISFSASDSHGNLLPWMRQTIANIGINYSQKKRKIYKTVGYEDRYGVAQLSVKAHTKDEILANLLGLGKGLAVSHFEFTPARLWYRSSWIET
jgi:hypothetical protein